MLHAHLTLLSVAQYKKFEQVAVGCSTENLFSYKRSSRLQPKVDDEVRPKRSYNIVKPVVNDDFDKQV